MNRLWKWIISVSFCLLLIALLAGYGIRFNRSNSLKQMIFISASIKSPLVKEQIVSFDHPNLQATLGKILIGFPGDQISIRDQMVFVNDREIGLYKTASSSGKTYSPISQEIVPEGHYFVYTPHPESFDSRYEEFGLIEGSWIKEVLWPLF
ncbi:MAG: S26 family signal peptidase [Chlamydiales bacterium]